MGEKKRKCRPRYWLPERLMIEVIKEKMSGLPADRRRVAAPEAMRRQGGFTIQAKTEGCCWPFFKKLEVQTVCSYLKEMGI